MLSSAAFLDVVMSGVQLFFPALFGITAALQYALQADDRGVPFHLLLATPYVVTLLILCGVAGRVRAPEWLGRR